MAALQQLFEDALTALRRQRYNEAHDLFSEAMELAPEMPEVHYNLGIASGHLYRWRDAEECFRMAIRVCPFPRSDYHTHLGLARLHLRRWEEAAVELRRALELDAASEVAQLYLEDLESFLARRDALDCPYLTAAWFDPRLEDFAGVDPEIVPKAERGDLRAYLAAALAEEPCDHTHRFTEEWALRSGRDPLGVSRFLYERQLRCDCEVLAEPERRRGR